MKVTICVPTVKRPYEAFLRSMEKAAPLLEMAGGWDVGLVFEVGNPYISAARATMLRKALDAKSDAVVFIDHDIGFRPQDLVRLVAAEGDVVAGTYRFKEEAEHYMGWLVVEDHAVQRRKDGALLATHVPGGFLKLTRAAVNRFVEAYPELLYGERCNPHVDLFNHGAIEWAWFSEDYAFSKRWRDAGGSIWLLPELEIDHYGGSPGEEVAYPGNFASYITARNFKIRNVE